MKTIFLTLVITFSMSFAVFAQTSTKTTQTASATTTKTTSKSPIFRANKDQILQTQKALKVPETGKLDPATRAAIKAYQPANGLKATGTLNRATLEKMNITLTDKQKEIPVPASSFASPAGSSTKSTKSATSHKAVFRANKGQIMDVQKMLKDKGMYSGEPSGKLDDLTREGIKKFQTSVGMKVTGTLNKETLEKMGITLTDAQKAM